MVTPLVVDDRLIGVMGLGFFDELEPQERRDLTEVSRFVNELVENKLHWWSSRDRSIT
jgi:hypothetical protein